MYCHGGCKPKAICAALGLQVSDLGGYDKRIASSRIIATYEYISIDGEVLATKVRSVPKSFRGARPAGRGR